MTAGTIITPILGVDLAAVVTGTGSNFDQGNQHKLGTRVTTHNGQEWVYVHANGAVAQYRFVGFDKDFEAATLTAQHVLDGWQIGLADAVAAADNDFFWVCQRGAGLTGRVSAGVAANIQLYTTSTAGQLSDAALTSVGVSVASMVGGIIVYTAGSTSVAANVAVLLQTIPFSTPGNY